MYTYAQAETILARCYGADEDVQRNAFRGRLKHLKRLGIPLGVSPGRGKKVLYSREQIFQWALCLELSEFGIDPTITARFIEALWETFPIIISWAFTKSEDDNDIIYVINPAVMSKTWAYSDVAPEFRDRFPDFLNFRAAQLSDGNDLLQGLKNIVRRAMIMNLSEVLRMIDAESRNLGIQPEMSNPRARRVGDGIVAAD